MWPSVSALHIPQLEEKSYLLEFFCIKNFFNTFATSCEHAQRQLLQSRKGARICFCARTLIGLGGNTYFARLMVGLDDLGGLFQPK